MPLGTFLAKVFGGSATNLVDKGFALIDNLTLSKEEKEQFKSEFIKLSNDHIEKMAALTEQEFEAQLKDIADARSSNVQIQNSEKASWMAKNVAYCIDIFVVFVWGFLTVYLLCVMLSLVKKETGVDYTAVTAVWGGVTAFAGTILNFHRGSSKSSEDKQKQINTLMNKES